MERQCECEIAPPFQVLTLYYREVVSSNSWTSYLEALQSSLSSKTLPERSASTAGSYARDQAPEGVTTGTAGGSNEGVNHEGMRTATERRVNPKPAPQPGYHSDMVEHPGAAPPKVKDAGPPCPAHHDSGSSSCDGPRELISEVVPCGPNDMPQHSLPAGLQVPRLASPSGASSAPDEYSDDNFDELV